MLKSDRLLEEADEVGLDAFGVGDQRSVAAADQDDARD